MMNNDKLQEIIDFFELEQGYDKNILIADWIGEIHELKGYAADEIGLEWGGKSLMVLDDFVGIFYQQVINGVCNVLESFKEDE